MRERGAIPQGSHLDRLVANHVRREMAAESLQQLFESTHHRGYCESCGESEWLDEDELCLGCLEGLAAEETPEDF